jgi:hypothetical protein
MEHEFLRGCVRLLSGKEDLIDSLNARLETEFERRLFEAAVNNLLDAYNPLRFNNFAYATRELVRHILSRLAPDPEVRACIWYKNETDRKDGVTRSQRITYSIQGGLSDKYIYDKLSIDTKSTRTRIRDVVDTLSKHTHIQPTTFDIDPNTQDIYVSETLDSLRELFDVIDDSRRAVSEALIDHIDRELFSKVISKSIDEIDEVSTHHAVEDIETEQVEVLGISSCSIDFSVQGTIAAELQWGSNGDVRRGDGVVFCESFRFSCKLSSDVRDPGNFPEGVQDFRVYNDDWYDDT